jgi:hypothetical protein
MKGSLGLSIVLALTAGAGMLAAPGQTALRPGDMTPARMYIDNRGRDQAIPVLVQDPVTIAGTPTVAIAPTSVVPVRLTRQAWEYRTVALVPAQDPANTLLLLGSDGWETTGVQVQTQNGLVLLLKRPR